MTIRGYRFHPHIQMVAIIVIVCFALLASAVQETAPSSLLNSLKREQQSGTVIGLQTSTLEYVDALAGKGMKVVQGRGEKLEGRTLAIDSGPGSFISNDGRWIAVCDQRRH